MVDARLAGNPRGLGGNAAGCPGQDPKKSQTFWIVAGLPARDIAKLAADLKLDLLVIGAGGHSALYERMAGSRADRIMQLAQCPVLIVR